MVTLLALFFPAVLSVWIFDGLTKGTLTNRKWIYLYSINTLLVNLICFALKKWVLHSGAYTIEGMTPNSAINYILVAVVISVVLALIEYVCHKWVRIQVESDSNAEEEGNEENRQ